MNGIKLLQTYHEIQIKFKTTTKLPMMPQAILTSTPAIRALRMKSNCNACQIVSTIVTVLKGVLGKDAMGNAVSNQIDGTLIGLLDHLRRN